MNLTNPRAGRRRPKTDPVACFALHPDGCRIFLGSKAASITIWDIDAQRSVGAIEHQGAGGELLKLALSPRGRTLVAVLSSGIASWDLEDGDSIHAPHPQGLRDAEIRFPPSGPGRALTTSGSNCEIWNVETGALIRTLVGDRSEVRRAGLSTDGARVLSIDAAHTLRLWDVDTGACLRAWSRAGHSDPAARVLGVAWSPDCKKVLSATLGDTLLLDTDRGEPKWLVSGPSPDVRTSIFHPDGRRALMVGHNGAIELWELGAGRVIRTFRDTRGDGGPLALCPDGRRMICRTEDPRSWRAIDIETGTSVTAMRPNASPIRSVLPHPDGLRLIAAGDDEPIMVWSLETGAPAGMLGRSRDSGTIGGGPVAVSKSGAQALTAHEDGAVNLWDTRQGTCVRVPITGGSVHCMIFHQGERHALFAIETRVEIWDLLLMYRVDSLELRSKVCALACFGHRLYAASLDFRLRVWDVSSGRCMLAVDSESPGHKPALNAWLQWVAFTELTGEPDLVPSVKVLQIDGGEVLGQLSWEKFREIYLVALHEEGELAIVAGADSAHVWDIRHRSWRHSIRMPDCYLIHVAIEIHGGWALLTHRRGIAIWDLTSGELTEEWGADAEVTEAAVGGDGTIAVSCSDGGVYLLRAGEHEVPLVEERIESIRTTLAGMADRYRNPKGMHAFEEWSDAGREVESEARASLSWLEAYQAEVDIIEPAFDQSLENVLARLDRMVDEVSGDPAYPAPDQVRRRVRKVLEKYHTK